MVSRHVIEHQLHRIGFNPFSWGRTEVRELCNIMMDDEEIAACVNGEYANGFALLAATNHRVLLVDKKPFLYLTVEDVRFEQIGDFNFRNRFLTAQVTISTSNKTMHFTSYNKKSLRKLINCVQTRVIEIREREHQPRQDTGQALTAAQMYGYSHGLMQGQQMASAQPTQQDAQFAGQFPQLSQPAEAEKLAVQQPQTAQKADPPPKVQPEAAPEPKPPHHSFLGTYTRGKLPSLGLHSKNTPVSGSEIYQQGYAPGSVPDYIG